MGATASMTQINARIDPGLKAGGDAGLEAAGYTTTQAIRALWKPASRLRGKPERLGGLGLVMAGLVGRGANGTSRA